MFAHSQDMQNDGFNSLKEHQRFSFEHGASLRRERPPISGRPDSDLNKCTCTDRFTLTAPHSSEPGCAMLRGVPLS
ncbi:hypothetical protein [Massilia sp. BJB1822]|uniref:hypothetical protein n=1 Tax=Massilia sp. BJB1822 TaxID=2744470 RepID=UPI00280607AE|nr:hypothetical protein [Massilia sp. BJB1822]